MPVEQLTRPALREQINHPPISEEFIPHVKPGSRDEKVLAALAMKNNPTALGKIVKSIGKFSDIRLGKIAAWKTIRRLNQIAEDHSLGLEIQCLTTNTQIRQGKEPQFELIKIKKNDDEGKPLIMITKAEKEIQEQFGTDVSSRVVSYLAFAQEYDTDNDGLTKNPVELLRFSLPFGYRLDGLQDLESFFIEILTERLQRWWGKDQKDFPELEKRAVEACSKLMKDPNYGSINTVIEKVSENFGITSDSTNK